MIDRKQVWVRHLFVGFHRWPGAGAVRFYLGYPHRHVFHVTVEVDVDHDDRQVEFHDLIAKVEHFCRTIGEAAHGGGRDLGTRSCEQVASELWEFLGRSYPGRRVAVAVVEDGEAGGRVSGITPDRDGGSVQQP